MSYERSSAERPRQPSTQPRLSTKERRALSEAKWYGARLRRRMFAALACIIAAAVLTWGAVYTAWGQSADTLFMEAAMRWRFSLGSYASLITGLVSVPAIVLVAVAVVGVAVARRRPTLAGRAVGMVAAANASTQLLKAVLERPDLDVTTVIPNSLPSGHTTVAMSVTLALVMVAPEWLRGPSAWVGWLWTALMGFAVMMSAWHRLADVLVSVLICGAWALLLTPIEQRARHVPGMRRAMLWAVVIVFAFAVLASVIALIGVDVAAVATPGASGYGFSLFLAEQPWRARLLAVTGMLWIISVTGFVIHEVDSLCDSHDR